ncbi:MAG: magnesium protoporphyrin IX methyltransferase [Halorhodospira halophila]|uniref:magnesium protoporphyrin IX methyltransferase n=1 Tax=Halorhodospira TaxID=85108 RepID=UPI001EE7BC45|nr:MULTISPECIES: magnesium protoporphyrin IX methyltransferase [Halorhodospira]MCC3750975.1 magnesium protoporphyrin IX methyltransferase [Halorhodospira halophila]MCG5527940.1 magnesium protoporphyrin IX methyltransferase [Halorhodospira halophila]MCG5533268.1 magnesium protoporphyrin IX methyltransferase [Halorhodospira sp. 9621]MCG5539619.1 magnesium protoporphyrin IX methyltransferase [Halorhodospira sp. M39old]MCG5542190.1 magnesium protoporphyrin IX methyltransferase [Halorhodospira sp. 
MPTESYQQRRSRVTTYFDRTATKAWERLTSDAPVSGVRATVRAGRAEMRQTLLDWLPADLTGERILDAGCGPGELSVEAARRGAHVVGVDVSQNLIDIAHQRMPDDVGAGRLAYHVGDMLDPDWGEFDRVVSMDVLIHYPCADAVAALAGLARRTRQQMVFTFAPRTPLLATMHAVGKLFPRGDRSPAIEPVAERRLRQAIGNEPTLGSGWQVGRTRKIARGFYISQALELQRP